LRSVLRLALVITVALIAVSLHALVVSKPLVESYPYGGRQFSVFVEESFANGGPGKAPDFFNWMNRAYEKSPYRFPHKKELNLERFLLAERQDLAAIKDASAKTRAILDLSAWLHRLVKKTIPRFSLDRGYEFCNVVRFGERQCFLQSVLIAGLLQRMGVNAGVAMVYKNINGQEINNGHAVTLVKLPNGQDIIVDASDQEPFARHQGLFVRTAGYQYVRCVFAKTSPRISSYVSATKRTGIAAARVRTLDVAFLRSQFYYYRGERVKGGLVCGVKSKKGLARATRYLETSVKLCPENPLAVYMLGRAYLDQSRRGKACDYLARAQRLYVRFGWVPAGPGEYLAAASHCVASR
jgi:hypothetical protein